MSGRHAQSREPRGHWLLLLLILPAVFATLLFEGWTTHELDAAKTRRNCTTPVPESVDNGGPVLSYSHGRVESAGLPPRTAAVTVNGGPDPEWTPRFLDLLRKHHVHATFFVFGAQAAQHPDLVRQIRAEGHEIGSNTYTGAAMGSASGRVRDLEGRRREVGREEVAEAVRRAEERRAGDRRREELSHSRSGCAPMPRSRVSTTCVARASVSCSSSLA